MFIEKKQYIVFLWKDFFIGLTPDFIKSTRLRKEVNGWNSRKTKERER